MFTAEQHKLARRFNNWDIKHECFICKSHDVYDVYSVDGSMLFQSKIYMAWDHLVCKECYGKINRMPVWLLKLLGRIIKCISR